jgi:hypothetical protein
LSGLLERPGENISIGLGFSTGLICRENLMVFRNTIMTIVVIHL